MAFAIIFILIAMLFFLITYWTYHIAFYSSPKKREDIMSLPKGEQYEYARETMGSLIRELVRIPFEQVSITTFDGTELIARYYHIKDNAPLQIQFHGYRGSGVRDFCGGNKIAREMGHNTLLVTQRAHGKSGGKTITFGIKEQYDCLHWINYAINRFGEDIKIIISGVSMGAVTVLKASALDLPRNVIGIIADSPYSSTVEIIKKVSSDMKFNPNIVYPFIKVGAKMYGKINLDNGDVISAVKKSKMPILLIHGTADRFVPYEMSCSIYAASPKNIQFESFEKAGHGLSYIQDGKRYKEVIETFIGKCVN